MSDVESDIRNRVKYRGKTIYRCFLCHKDGREIAFDNNKEWFQMDQHFLRYHQKEMALEFRTKYLKSDVETLR